jgi:hypothetical protein
MVEMLTYVLVVAIAIGADLGVVLLVMRGTGTKLPEWAGPKWLVDRVNHWIEPDRRRLDRLQEIAMWR